MPASTAPATPSQAGAAGGTPSTSATGNVAGPDHTLLSFVQFQFVKHARINDLHQASNNDHGDAVADTQDIDQLFATNRADIKGDADLLKAVHRLLIEKVIAPCATETSGADRAAVIKPAIDQASFEVSDPKGKHNVRLSKSNLTRILNGVTTGGNEATIVVQVSTSHMCIMWAISVSPIDALSWIAW